MGRYNGDSGLFTFAEFKNRGVIKMAPDALVFISGNLNASVIAPVTGATQRIDFRDGISNISIQNNVDPPGSSSASVEIITPIYNDKSHYWIQVAGEDGRLYRVPIFVPMMEIKIYLKGRFLVGDEPKYYPAFWGFITAVDESYSGGIYKMVLQCADMLAWWSRIQVAFRPGVDQAVFTGGMLTAYHSRYQQANAFDIIYSLCANMGYENFITPDWLGHVTPRSTIFPWPAMKTIWGGILDYWRVRWAGQVNLLKMFGAHGQLINDPQKPKVTTPEGKGKFPQNADCTNKSKQATNSDVTKRHFTISDRFTKGFQVFHEFEKMGDVLNAEYQDKLQIATEVKTRVEYEFFQDVNGNFIFKPPFYNLNTKYVLPYQIKPNDILNYSFGIHSDEIVTCLEVMSSVSAQIRGGETSALTAVGYHIDMDLAKRYGHRFKKISLYYMTDISMVQTLAAGHLSLQNVKAFAGSVTIPGRPEIRLGYPVWIEHMDAFYYVKSINHAFDFGGSFTTTLSLEGERKRVYAIDARLGTWTLMKNKVYLLTDNFTQPPGVIRDKNKTSKDQTPKNTCTKVEQLGRDTGKIKSMEPGRYEVRNKTDKDVETKVFGKKVPKGTDKDETLDMVTRYTVPLTDEEGYKLIGSFRYGRGIVLGTGAGKGGAELLVNPDSKNMPSDQIIPTQEAQFITQMKPVAAAEGEYMATFFQTNAQYTGPDNTRGIETVIPSYLTELSEENALKDPDYVAQMVTTLGVAGVVATPEAIYSGQVFLFDSEDIGKQSSKIRRAPAAKVSTSNTPGRSSFFPLKNPARK